ncbi:MAG: Trk system potassium transporter TrkA [Bdellovibrionales bacterium]|nr:Trk system potassium transporter TrkA [Bdellovibrionales bacterium]
MRFVVIGAGNVGVSLTEKLAVNQHDVVLIDDNEEKLNAVVSSMDCQGVLGNGCSPEVLSRARIHEADYVVAVTNNDAVNIAACVSAKLLHPSAKRIVRIRELEFNFPGVNKDKLNDYFDLIINPSQAGAEYLLRMFKVPGAKEVVEFADGKVRVIGVSVSPRSPLLGRKLQALGEYREKYPLLIIAILRGSRLIIPRGTDKLRVGDIMYLVTPPEHTNVIFELAGKELHQGRSAMIWCGGSLGRRLAHSLEEMGTEVKLIVSDTDDAEALADEFQSALVLQGEGTDHNLLLEENVQDFDAFISVTPDEEDNVLAALLAKRLGAKSSMALVNKISYIPLVAAIGVDVVVSSLTAAASQIFKHIHSGSIVSEFSLRHRGAGFLELIADEKSEFLNVPIKTLHIPEGILICAILRGDSVIIPRGDDTIKIDDRVVVFVARTAIKKVEKALGMKVEFVR